MRCTMLIAVFAVVAGSAAAVGQEAPRGGDRYLVTEIEGGILRVDRQTGAVSVCRDRDGRWSCELVPDDRDILLGEVEDLRQQNRALRRDGPDGGRSFGDDDGLGGGLGSLTPRADDGFDDMDGTVTREEVDEAMDSFEYMMERLMGAAERLNTYQPQQTPPQPR